MFRIIDSSEIFSSHLHCVCDRIWEKREAKITPRQPFQNKAKRKHSPEFHFTQKRNLFYIRLASDAQINCIYYTPWPNILIQTATVFAFVPVEWFPFYDQIDICICEYLNRFGFYWLLLLHFQLLWECASKW